jgi:anti-sigma-K factor RskA
MNEEEFDEASRAFARRAGELLEQSAGALPARIRSRLTRARHAALAQSRPTRSNARALWRAWLPASAAAAAVLTVLLLQGPNPGSGTPQAASGGNEDFEMLADSGAYALAQDQLAQGGEVDYEFYDWAVNSGDDEHGAAAGS